MARHDRLFAQRAARRSLPLAILDERVPTALSSTANSRRPLKGADCRRRSAERRRDSKAALRCKIRPYRLPPPRCTAPKVHGLFRHPIGCPSVLQFSWWIRNPGCEPRIQICDPAVTAADKLEDRRFRQGSKQRKPPAPMGDASSRRFRSPSDLSSKTRTGLLFLRAARRRASNSEEDSENS